MADILIAHDSLEQADGGSRLCLELGAALGAPLLCGYVRSANPLLADFSAPLTVWARRPLALQWRLARVFARALPQMLAAQCVVFSGSYTPLGVLPRRQLRPGGRNILYCHTPPRFLYEEQEVYARMLAAPLRPAFRLFCAWLRPQVEEAARNMDVIVANSRTVQGRIARLWGLESELLHPPCRVERYAWQPPQGYYLSMARLDRLKRVDVLVRAFMRLPKRRLVVISSGPEASQLRALAEGAPNIVFKGQVEENERLRLLGGCIASLCVAKDEDFGMVVVESLAAGKPVIVAGAGGLAEIVRHEQTGFCLGADPEPDEVVAAVRALDESVAWAMRHACCEAAQAYDVKNFARRMAGICRQAPSE